MGYVTLGIFTLTKQGIEGSIYQMISHGLISAAYSYAWEWFMIGYIRE